MNRRELVGAMMGGLALAVPAAGDSAVTLAPSMGNGTSLPIFNPRSYGAAGDGKSLDSGSINAAIIACNLAGGGVVYLSPGTYLCGTVVLKSNVTLYLEAGATILGSTRLGDYGRTDSRQKGFSKGSASHRCLLFATDAVNVGLAGPGRINGQGHTFWHKKVHPTPVTDANRWSSSTTHVEWEPRERPTPMVDFQNITNLRIEDVHLEEAPGWTLRSFNCTHESIHGIVIKNYLYGPNTDGIDIIGCQDVTISDCMIDTGDDSICLKSEDVDGVPCRTTKNIVVTNCIMTGGRNGFRIGPESHGGFENITFSNSVIYNDEIDIPDRMITGICLGVLDGGWLDGIVVTGIQMRRIRCPILIRLGDRSRSRLYPQQGMRNILIDGLHASDTILTSSITGIPEKKPENIRLANIDIGTMYPGKKEWVKHPIPEIPAEDSDGRMFGWLPASGLYCRHIEGLSLQNVRFSAPVDEWRPTVICDSVEGLTMRGLETTPIQQGLPPIGLRNVDHAWVSGAVAPVSSQALVSVSGNKGKDILVSGCDLREALKVAEFEDGAATSILQAEFNTRKQNA